MMKISALVWVAVAACLVGQVVFAQLEAPVCALPDGLRDVAQQSTLSDVVQMLEAVWNAIAWPNVENPSLLSDPVYLLTRKTRLNTFIYLSTFDMISYHVKFMLNTPIIGGRRNVTDGVSS